MASQFTETLVYRPRPVIQNWDCSSSDLIFMQLDIDTTSFPNKQSTKINTAIIRIFGITAEGISVCAYVKNFLPYFYSQKPENFLFNSYTKNEFVDQLNSKVGNKDIIDIEVVQKRDLMYYQGNQTTSFFKIFLGSPKSVAPYRNVIEKGIEINGEVYRSQTYESGTPFPLRFMVDKDIVGFGWLKVQAGNYQLVLASQKRSHCQLEIELDYHFIENLPNCDEYAKIAPLRILSFDIECMCEKGILPSPKKQEVIQISNILQIVGEAEPIARNVFTLGSCAEILGSQVKSFTDEKSLLKAWHEFLIEADPDIITGYNIINFDFNYLIERAKHLKIADFPFFSRIMQEETTVKQGKLQSKQMGFRESKELHLPGRILVDMYHIVQRDFKLSQYTLNFVSMTFLNECKEDVNCNIIKDLQQGNQFTRRRLAVYCIKDSFLPLKLMEKFMVLYTHAEMARVTGTPFKFLMNRGQMIKVLSLLFRKAKQQNFVIPTYHSQNKQMGDTFEGAFVLEPEKGFYKNPIATLDFASLYPSIIIAHNLCYTTILTPQMAKQLSPEEQIFTPNGDKFCSQNLRVGLLPQILTELIEARKIAKNELKQAKDPFMKMILDGRQLALKICANSVYGFTGATAGALPCLPISASVCAYGRTMIELTKKEIEQYYANYNGYKDAKVLYGDTDSVMIDFGEPDIRKAMELGRHASALITKKFPMPIKLEFEKIYYPFLLIAKKRYAGLLYTNPDKYDKMDCKGIETVRRDNCQIVRDLLNTCLNKILINQDVEGAINYVKFAISDLLQNKLDLSLLIITKAISKNKGEEQEKNLKKKNEYKAKQPHVELAERMKQRDPTTAPGVGDRVAYVIIKGAKGQKLYELAEDPVYVMENDIPIDYEYYLENQLKKPLERLFEPILPKVDQLFYGEHTKHRYQAKIQATNNKSNLTSFIQIKPKCISCQKQVDEGNLCNQCQQNFDSIYLERVLEFNRKEQEFHTYWMICLKCQGHMCQEVICTNRECPIFYRREKCRREMRNQQHVIEKLTW